MQTGLLKNLRPVTEIIGDSFPVFFKNIVNLFWFQLIYVAAAVACMAPGWIYMMLKMAPLFKMPKDLPPEAAQQLAAQVFTSVFSDLRMWLILLIGMVILTIAAVWRMAAVSVYLEGQLLGKPLGIKESFKKSYGVVVPFIFTAFLTVLAVYAVPLILGAVSALAFFANKTGLGVLGYLGVFVAMIAAWFVFMAILPLAQVIALKGKYYLDAVKYSWRLVRGGYWPAVGFFLLIIAIMMGLLMVAMAAQWIVYFIGLIISVIASLVPFLGIAVMVITTIASMLIQMLPQAYMDVPLVMYYVNREAVKGDGEGRVAQAAKTIPSSPSV